MHSHHQAVAVTTEDLNRGKFSGALMHAAARLYYLEDATQAEIASRLGTSRTTVSRVLAEARRQGIVRIEVVAPREEGRDALAEQLRDALGLAAVHLSALGSRALGHVFARGLAGALTGAGLTRGDALLISSGRSIYEAAQSELPSLPGVMLAPTLGGQDEPEAWYATNELTRQIAERVGGAPVFLYAPALPQPRLHQQLMDDPSVQRVLRLWNSARAAVVGVGAPLSTRTTLPRFVPERTDALRHAVGDICGRFYDAEGEPIRFPGSERMIATRLEQLREIPVTIALAAGAPKIPSILAAARAGYFNHLVTDEETALGLLTAGGDAAGKTGAAQQAGQT